MVMTGIPGIDRGADRRGDRIGVRDRDDQSVGLLRDRRFDQRRHLREIESLRRPIDQLDAGFLRGAIGTVFDRGPERVARRPVRHHDKAELVLRLSRTEDDDCREGCQQTDERVPNSFHAPSAPLFDFAA